MPAKMITSTIHFYFCYFAAVYSLFASIAIHLLHLLQLYDFIQPKGPITFVYVFFALHLKQRRSSNSFNCSSVKFKVQSPVEMHNSLILFRILLS